MDTKGVHHRIFQCMVSLFICGMLLVKLLLRMLIRCLNVVQKPFTVNIRCHFQRMTSFLALYVIVLVIIWLKFSIYLGLPYGLQHRRASYSRSRGAEDLVPSPVMLYSRLFELSNDSHQSRMEADHALAWLRRRSQDDKLVATSLPLGKITLEKGGGNDSRVDVKRYMLHGDNPVFRQWALGGQSGCDGRVWAYSNIFMSFQGLTLDRTKAQATAQGGETAESVINQPEASELYTLSRGAFRLACHTSLPQFSRPTEVRPLSGWITALQIDALENATCPNRREFQKLKDVGISRTPAICEGHLPEVVGNFTILTTRYEYANVYWTLIDLYDSFLVMRFLGRQPGETTILLLDAHPATSLDPLWRQLFSHVVQLSQLPLVTELNESAWNLPRRDSPLLVQSGAMPPLLEDFRLFVLSQLGSPVSHPFGCVFNNSRVLFIWRRDYLSHPRNPQKIISRKISNEEELLLQARTDFPDWSIRGIQLDQEPVGDQIFLVSQSDIIVGMHGAALAFSIFLQPGSGLVELFPIETKGNWHMKYLAQWSQVHYVEWTNRNISLENKAQKSTYIPPAVITSVLSQIHSKMCPHRFAYR